jgi:hypothetical protein
LIPSRYGRVQGGKLDKEAGTLHVRVRHHKNNFGFQREPFDARLTFAVNSIKVEAVELDEIDLVTERTLNADDRCELVLRDGPAYPEEIAVRTGLAEGTVRNCLTRLRRAGKVEYTGEVQGRAQQVKLASSSSFYLRVNDDDDESDVWEF